MASAGRPAPIARRAGPLPAPLSFAQQGLWFLDQWAPGNPRYNVPMAVRLDGRLDVEALARAIGRVVGRHDILRTTFVEQRGEPVQIVSAASAVHLRVVDASAIGPAARPRAVRRLLRQDVWQPFDLARGPLVRMTLFRTGADAHVLATTVHHIISDAWSVDVLLREVTSIYAALVARRQPMLPPLPVQYGDYAAWERTRLTGAALERLESYWEGQLAGVAPLELPADRPRPAARTFAGGSARWQLSPEVSLRVRDLVRRERVTFFILLVAAFAAALRRFARQDDIALGTPMTTRAVRETEPLVGLFLNTLVLRLQARGDETFLQFLSRARAVVLGAFAHRDMPFERLVERLQPSRRDDAPLFNVMVAVQPRARAEGRIDGLTVTPVPVPDEAIRYDLTLFAREDGDAIAGVLSYGAELFEAATAANIARHLTAVLRRVSERPATTLDGLSLLTSGERADVLARGRGPTVAPPPAAGVHELFERQAALAPDAAAVLRDDRILSYAEVDRAANQLARALAARAAGRGTRVALCLDRRPPLVVALLGIMKAGACYVPLDPAYPPRRLRRIVDDAAPAVLLTETRFEPLWRDLPGVHVVYLDRDAEAIAAHPATNPGWLVTPDDPAYVIYTSGSTGAPKGVVVPHKALTNSCLGVVDATGIGPGDRFLHFAPIGFDVSAFQIFPALVSGAATVLADPASELSNDDIYRLCERAGLTILDLPSAVWQQWVAEMAERRRPLPARLRVFMTGGEATPMEPVRAWASMVAGSTRFISSYGPTETAVATMWRGVAAEVPGWPAPVVTLGGPLANVQLYVVDPSMRLVPPGVAGELCCAGSGLAIGYVNRPDLTAAQFAPDPFGAAPGGRLYRTGDRVRYRTDGTLEFLGRFDHQLKLRGVRIEAGEIEAVLRQHPAVRAAAVAIATRTDARRVLAAYVVAGDEAIDEAGLRQHLAAHLPAAMVPSAFVFLDALPISANGKLDRRALPVPDVVESDRAVTAPRTHTEQLLAEMWSEALGVSAVGVDDDFFALGGHSLAAVRLASRLREAFGIELPVRAIFEAPTVATIARLIDRRRAQHLADRAPLVKVPRDAPIPLSFAQQGFWLLEQFHEADAVYANPEVIRLRGAFSVRAFADALSWTVERHEVLRTTFHAVDGEPRQIVGPARRVAVPVVDLEPLPLTSREAAVRALAIGETRRAFDLSTGPLVRATVLRLTPDDHVVLFTMHHIVSDLASIAVLLGELGAGYRAAWGGAAPQLPPLPIQYADYAAWERRRWHDAALDEAVARRRAQIGGAVPDVQLPTDRPRGPSPRLVGGRQAIVLPEALLARVREAGRREGVTLFMSLLAALQTLLHLYTGQESILVAVPVANRDDPATEGLIGYFVNHVVVVTRFDGAPTCRELLGRARAAALDALDAQDLPFEEFVRRVRPERRGSHTPLHRVMFNVLNQPDLRLELPGVHAEVAAPAARDTARFELEWVFVDTGTGVAGVLEYDRELFDAATAERMAAQFGDLLEAFVETPDRPLSTLSLMSATQESLALAFNEPL